MAWGTTEYQYTIHALGAVESGMDYGATNPNDAITVGLIQWYGTRAANLLDTMRSTNPSDWISTGGMATLDADLTAHASTDASFWTNRHLTLSERQNLHTILTASGNVTVQDTQASTDIDAYLSVFTSLGGDQTTHPETAAFFCNIYNRNPSAARRIIGNCGPTSSLDRIYTFTINDTTERAYTSRYSQAKTIIAAHDTTGVGGGGTGGSPGEGNGGGGSNGGVPPGKAAYVTRRGNQLYLLNKDGTRQTFTQVKEDYWLASQDATAGSTPPGGGSGGPPPGTALADILTWLNANLNAFAYSQDGGRLNPPVSGYTDCSGLLYYAFLTYADMDIGTWTGTQSGNATPLPPDRGTVITSDSTVAVDGTTVHVGDLVFYRWYSPTDPVTYDHVAIYIGSDQVISHGGPDNGPDIESHSGNVGAAMAVLVKRYF